MLAPIHFDGLADPALRITSVRLTLAAGERLVSEHLERAGNAVGTDAAGSFALSRYRLVPDEGAAPKDAGELQLRRYANGVVLATLAYLGPKLAARHAVQVMLQPQRFGRGMALSRYNPFWTGPVFGSDYRFWPEHGVLALWRQAGQAPYHLLAPLAGEGLVGEVGVANDRFGVSLAAGMPTTPKQLPLFAYASGEDPYALPRALYETAFTVNPYYGRLRWQKTYPEVYRKLGWCSWNAYYNKVTEADVLASAKSLRAHHVPVGFMLVDDGWLTTKAARLAGPDADAQRFPHGLAWLATRLRQDYQVPHVGVWHALQGYWDGVDASCALAKGQPLFLDREGRAVPAGRGLYDAWYDHLKAAGIDFVKVDNQAGTVRFVDGQRPLFSAAEDLQRGVQEAAASHFDSNLLNCMEQRPEHVYNWHHSNLARTSNDYEPDQPLTSAEHIFQNGYNAYWLSNFAYPDYDMFVSARPDAPFHAIARAISGGPAYTADRPGEENPTLLASLAMPDGRLLQPDEPALPTRDTLLVDTGLEPVPLKLWSSVSRPGYRAGLVAAFNVNKSHPTVSGRVSPADAQVDAANVAVWSSRRGLALGPVPVSLGAREAELCTIVPIHHDMAVFGLLDKLIGPAAVTRVSSEPGKLNVSLAAPGELGVYLKRAPKRVLVDGRDVAYSYARGLLRVKDFKGSTVTVLR